MTYTSITSILNDIFVEQLTQNLSTIKKKDNTQLKKNNKKITLASLLTVGLLANWTSVAFSIVFSSRMVACDWLCPNGYKNYFKKILQNSIYNLNNLIIQ